MLIDKAIEIRDRIAARWAEILKREPRWKLGLLERLKERIRPSKIGAQMSFEELKVEGQSVWTSRLGWGKVILVANYIEIMPDVDGDYTVVWGFENWANGIRMGGNYDMYTQVIPSLKAGVSSGKILLREKLVEEKRPEFDGYTFFDDIGLNAYGLRPYPAVYTVEHRVRATVTSPSGEKVTVEATWSDKMSYKLLGATLTFGESKA